jgi:TPP-dependent pyruvate/acetoin dehydrogenase alpha subunit
MYVCMNRLQSLDDVLYNAQRQGRISFYMQNSGEEGIQVVAVAVDSTLQRYPLTDLCLRTDSR